MLARVCSSGRFADSPRSRDVLYHSGSNFCLQSRVSIGSADSQVARAHRLQYAWVRPHRRLARPRRPGRCIATGRIRPSSDRRSAVVAAGFMDATAQLGNRQATPHASGEPATKENLQAAKVCLASELDARTFHSISAPAAIAAIPRRRGPVSNSESFQPQAQRCCLDHRCCLIFSEFPTRP